MTSPIKFSDIDEYSTLEQALRILSSFTKTSWSKDELFDAVVRFSLPVYAELPPEAVVGIRSVEVNGSRRMLTVPEIGRRYALLLTHEIDQLGKNQQIVTNRPALRPGDPDYKNWDEIKAGRETRRVKPGERSQYDKWYEPAGISGEWMGQSDFYFFTRTFPVYPNGELRFPQHTIIELIRKCLNPVQGKELRRVVPDYSPVEVHEVGRRIVGQDVGSCAAEVGESSGRVPALNPVEKHARKKWDEYALRRLLDESREGDATQEKLAAKNGITRQRVAVLLRRANELFVVKKASPFDFAGKGKRK